ALLAGTLMNYVGIAVTLAIASCINLLCSLLFLKILSINKSQKNPSVQFNFKLFSNYISDIKQGFFYIFSNKLILYSSLAASLIFPFMQALNVLIAPFNYRLLNGNDLTLGIVDSAIGLGSLISVSFCVLTPFKKVPLLLVASGLILIVLTVIFPMSNNYLIAFANYALIGIFMGNIKVMSKSLVYEYIETFYVGRTMTAISMLGLILAIIYSMFIGLIGEENISFAYYALATTLLIPIIFTILGHRKLI
ncbi:MAG: hypothetical protein ACREPR_12880, partial [Brasilonema sp.]